MKKTKDGLTIDNGLQQYETNDYPFYFKDRDALILTNNFLYMDRNADYGGRVEYFSEVAMTEDGGITLDDSDGLTIYGGMLHDGKDIFIFLEDTSVTYGEGNTVSIPALSTVVCFQGTTLLVYPYGEENAIYTELDDNGATAMMENGITVDLVNDIYYKPNGTKFLLYSSPEVFDVVSKGQEA
jgi:(2Fe-2S) ferredoxin